SSSESPNHALMPFVLANWTRRTRPSLESGIPRKWTRAPTATSRTKMANSMLIDTTEAPPPVAAEERSDPEEGDHDGDIAPDPVGFPLRSQISRLSGGIVLFGFLSGRSPLERREVEITCFHRKTLTTSRLPERSALR